MARRRLESAIRAGKCIENGDPLPCNFDKIDVQQTYYFGEERDGIYSLQYSYDGSLLAVGFGDGGIETVNTASGKLDKELRKHKYGALAVTCIRFSPKEHHILFAATSEGNVHACNTIDTTLQDIVDEGHNEINCMDFCRDGSAFATAGKDLDVRLYDADTFKCLRTFSGYHMISPEQNAGGHAQRIFALKFHPEYNEVFITGGWDNHLKVWDGRTPEGVQRTIHGPHVCGDGLDIKDKKILTASWVPKQSLQLWEYGVGGLISTLPVNPGQEGEFLYCCQFCDGDIALAGGSGTYNVQAVNINDEKVIGEVRLGRSVQGLDTYNGGRMFAYGGVGTQLKMGKLS